MGAGVEEPPEERAERGALDELGGAATDDISARSKYQPVHGVTLG